MNKNILQSYLHKYFSNPIILKQWKTNEGHTLVLIQEGDLKFILKILKKLSIKKHSLETTIKFLEIASKRGISVIDPYKNKDDNYITCIDGKLVYTTKYIEEKQKPQWDINFLKKIATTQAQLHNLASKICFTNLKKFTIPLDDFEFNLKLLAKTNNDWAKSLNKKGQSDLNFIKENFNSLPSGICHNDISMANVLCKPRAKPVFIDFDLSGLNIFAIDLGIAIKQLCLYPQSPFSSTKMQTYLNSYKELRTLTKKELRVLRAILLFTSNLLPTNTKKREDEKIQKTIINIELLK